MKAVQKFETSDGELFDTEIQAREHESLSGLIEEAARLILPKEFDNTDFANGDGYIQLSQERVNRFMSLYREAVARRHPDLVGMFDKNPAGIIGRYLCDSDSPCYKLWFLTSQMRGTILYGQPYFAKNPGEASSKCLVTLT